MKHSIFCTLLLQLIFATSYSQVKLPILRTSKNTTRVLQAKNTASEASVIVTQAVETGKTIRTTMNSLFPKKTGKGQIQILISETSFTDEHFQKLKSELENKHGKKDVMVEFKSGNIGITINCRQAASQVWETVPAVIQTTYQLLELSDGFVILKPKNSNS
jgi:hypothetical protein